MNDRTIEIAGLIANGIVAERDRVRRLVASHIEQYDRAHAEALEKNHYLADHYFGGWAVLCDLRDALAAGKPAGGVLTLRPVDARALAAALGMQAPVAERGP